MDHYMKGDIDFNIDYAKWTFDDDVVYRGTGKNDNIAVGGDYNTVYASGGNDRVSIWTAVNAEVYGEAGDDFIGTRSAKNPTIYGGEGNDSIRIDVSGAYANGGEDNDKFIIAGNAFNLTMDGGDGDDTFWFIESSKATISGGTGKNTYYFDPYEYGSGHRNELVITDLSNEDVIRYNFASTDGSELKWRKDTNTGYIVLYDAYGNFSITLENVTDIRKVAGVKYRSVNKNATLGEIFGIPGGGNVSLNAESTAAKILESYTDKNFKASDYGTKLKTIDGSAVTYDLNITANGLANKIIGGDGDDSINGGKGKDTLTGGDGADIFIYNNDDGDDIITDYTEDEDKIRIASGSISSATVNGKNVIFTIGKGHITVKGGKGKDITLIDAKGKEIVYPNDFEADSVIYNAAGTAATLTEDYEEDTFDASDSGTLKTIDASAVTGDLYITGNDLANKIFGGDGSDTLDGGAKNDTLTGGEGEDIFVYSEGDGNDTITDYTEDEDKISIASGEITSTSIKGNDFVFTIGTGKITVKDGADKLITVIDENGDEKVYPIPEEPWSINEAGTAIELLEEYEDGTFDVADVADYGSKLKTIDASAVAYGLEIFGNTLANKIIGGEGDDTLNGGKGNDTLTGGDGADVFVYNAGKDVITDYTAEDTIQIANGKISKTTVSGSNVVFTIGSSTLTVKNAKGKSLNIIDSSGKSYSTIIGGLTLTNSSNSKVTLSDNVEFADASKRTKTIKITGNELANTILGGTKNDTLYGGANSDSLVGNAGNDKLYGESGNDVLEGGKGNDSLWGGAGNDSLYGGAGNDVFIYKPGEGTDKIFDYAGGDILQILKSDGSAGGSFTKSAFSNGTLTLTISGGGKVIFDNVNTSTNFNINGTAYKINGSKLVK